MSTRRRAFVGLLVAAALVGVGAGEAQAGTLHFNAAFSYEFCDPSLCGTGNVAQFGSASVVVTTNSFIPIPDSLCAAIDSDAIITVADGTLTEHHSGLACASSPSSRVLQTNEAFTVTGGDGVFADATGGGSVHCRITPRPITCNYSGTITLP